MTGAPFGVVGQLPDALQQRITALLLDDARRGADPGRMAVVKALPGGSDAEQRAIVHRGIVEIIQVEEAVSVAGAIPVSPGEGAISLSVGKPAATLKYKQRRAAGISGNMAVHAAPDGAPVRCGICETRLTNEKETTGLPAAEICMLPLTFRYAFVPK